VKLFIELDGATAPLEECDWVLFAPCGCPAGCMVADVAPSEELAWKEFYPRKRDQGRAQKQGYRMVLMTRERWAAEVMPAMKAGCTCQPAPAAAS
jgi:hypothetical protein